MTIGGCFRIILFMKMIFNFINPPSLIVLPLLIGLLVSGCSQATGPNPQEGDKLQAVATTTIVADIVRNIGGDRIELDTLLPVGADPHSFQPAPRDLARLAQAEVIFVNGAGLEEFLLPLIEGANPDAMLVDVSAGIPLLEPSAGEAETEHSEGDPHVWTDPNLVLTWVQNIAEALSAVDPGGAALYQSNADSYSQELLALDVWVREQVETVAPEHRRLVTDHQVLGYFAQAYGFEQVGAILPGFSTVTEPTARELAALEDAIHDLGIKAVLLGNTISPTLAQQVAQDTGVNLVTIYTGSLSEPGGPAGTYLDYIRYNVQAIVEALK